MTTCVFQFIGDTSGHGSARTDGVGSIRSSWPLRSSIAYMLRMPIPFAINCEHRHAAGNDNVVSSVTGVNGIGQNGSSYAVNVPARTVGPDGVAIPPRNCEEGRSTAIGAAGR